MSQCRICERDVDPSMGGLGPIQHGKKHRREFADQTGISEATSNSFDYEIIVAYYNPEEAAKWAREKVMKAKVDGHITTLENWDEELMDKYENMVKEQQISLEVIL